jgi:hypothetical protein
VCFDRYHLSPTEVVLSDNGTQSRAQITWPKPDGRTMGAWANKNDTTEAGAYACVIAAVEHLRGLLAVHRAETLTGADYYVGPPGSGESDLENCLRLEVSGVDGGSDREVAKRLLAKMGQATRGASNLPALAGVIGFRAKLLMVRDVRDNA